MGLAPLIQAASPKRSRLPVLVVAGVEPEGERLVEERPEEGDAEGDPERAERPTEAGGVGGGSAAHGDSVVVWW